LLKEHRDAGKIVKTAWLAAAVETTNREKTLIQVQVWYFVLATMPHKGAGLRPEANFIF